MKKLILLIVSLTIILQAGDWLDKAMDYSKKAVDYSKEKIHDATTEDITFSSFYTETVFTQKEFIEVGMGGN